MFYWKEGKSWNYDISYPITRKFILNIACEAEKGIFFSLGYDKWEV
jgi:hypothetical protein